MSATARETILANLPIYIQTTWQKLLDFLSLSGQAYVDPELPAAVQCEDIEARLAATSDNSLLAGERGGLLEDPSPETMAVFREKIVAIRTAMCPPLPHSPPLRSLVDFVAFRYRSLGRPQPHLWYGALILLVLILPWARRYWPLLFSLGAVLLNHALISALLSNIQPRYVVVTNPMRAVLLCLLFFLVITLAVRLLDWLLTGRRAGSLSAVSQN